MVKQGITQKGNVSLIKRQVILSRILQTKLDLFCGVFCFCQEKFSIQLIIKEDTENKNNLEFKRQTKLQSQCLNVVGLDEGDWLAFIFLDQLKYYDSFILLIKYFQIEGGMEEVYQFDDCFQVELNIPKVKQIFFLHEHTLLVCYLPNNYTIVEIVTRNDIHIVKTGTFPAIIEDIKPYKANWIFFIEGNSIHLYDLMREETISIYSIQRSDIYQQKFKYEYVHDESLVIFYKTSILKSTPVTVYYDIHHLSVSDKFQKEKRSKVEYQELRKLSYCSGEVVSFQSTGFEIEISFLSSGITHRINSIFNLYLVEINMYKDFLLLHFTHEDLENEFATYEVTKKKVKKIERKQRKIDPHVYYNHNSTRSFVYKNFMNHRKGDHFSGIFRVKLTKQSKYLGMLKHLLGQDVGVQFRQTVLNLLM